MTIDLDIRHAVEAETGWCAELMAASDPWLTYRSSAQWSLNVLGWPGASLFIATVDQPVGFILLHPKGFLGSPYIAALVITEEFRGRGLGTELVGFAERFLSGSRHCFLCVSSFNSRALALYTRLGYAKIGDLPDFIVDGYSEFLLCKRLS
jgi:ribosomal protein S18 acetylase RimI-like enzyme